ncbi:hypothetical protein D3C72_1107650 [compost metagenome]
MQFDVVEEHFREMRIARQVLNGAHGHAGQRQVHDQLRQALMAVFGGARRADQRNHVVRAVRVGRPDLAAVQAPAATSGADEVRAGSDAGQVGTSPGLAHADAEEGVCAADARQVEVALRGRAVFQDQGRALAVGDPVRRHRCPRAQQFFRQHEAREVAALGAAVFARQRQAEPPALGKLAAEAGVKTHPGTRALVGLQAVQRVRQKGANLSAQGFVGVRNGAQFQRVDHGGEPKGVACPGRAHPTTITERADRRPILFSRFLIPILYQRTQN